MRAVGFARREDAALVAALSGTVMLLWVGGSSILPLLPVYLRHEGASTTLVGVTMAAYFAASVVTQLPVGRLADVIGCSPVVVGGIVAFALGSCGFALASGPVAAIGFRALQGVGSGAVLVASAAVIGREVHLGEQGRAFGALYGSQMLALAIGPLLGTIFGLSAMRTLFLGSALIALASTAPVLAVVRRLEHRPPRSARPVPGLVALEAVTTGGPDPLSPRVRSRGRPLSRNAALAGAALAFASMGLVTGVYESCWTLLLHLRRATTFDIGLSWTLFALPFALLSLPAGRVAERYDRRLLAGGSLLCSAGFAALYPFVHDVAMLVGLAVVEAAATVLASPAAVLVLTESTPVDQQGQAQGAVETARTAATALGAAASGALFATATVLPFVLAAGVMVLLVGAMAWCWRGLPGRLGLGAGADGAREPVSA